MWRLQCGKGQTGCLRGPGAEAGERPRASRESFRGEQTSRGTTPPREVRAARPPLLQEVKALSIDSRLRARALACFTGTPPLSTSLNLLSGDRVYVLVYIGPFP